MAFSHHIVFKKQNSFLCTSIYLSSWSCVYVHFGFVISSFIMYKHAQHTYKHTCMHAYIHSYIHTYTHTYKHTCMHAYRYIHTYIHTHTDIHSCTHTSIHPYIHTYRRYSVGNLHFFFHAISRERNCLTWDQTHGFPFGMSLEGKTMSSIPG